MSFKTLVYAYVLGGLTFIPLVILAFIFVTVYTSVPVGDPDVDKPVKTKLQEEAQTSDSEVPPSPPPSDLNDLPKTRKGWLTVRRTFEESASDGSYVQLVRSYLDARSKDPKKSRPKDMWYVVLKGKVLYLYEDEAMTECEAAIELGGHDVVIYPEGLLDGELFAKRNAICLKPKAPLETGLPSVTKEMKLEVENVEEKVEEKGGNVKKKQKEREKLAEEEKVKAMARQQALDPSTPWFIFVKSNVEMEDWYLAFVHASDHPANSSTLSPLLPIFKPSDMEHLVSTLDEQPDVIPMRWLNALIGRIFFSYYRTQTLESYIIGRLMKKLSKVKRPTFLTDVVVKEVTVGDSAPTFSKPMLKELTKEGDAALEVRLHFKGEIRITIQATATINLGTRFKSYTVKLVLAAVLRELDGNLLVKVKRPPSNRIWYAFTQMPKMVLDVEPVVSERQITWSMILSTIEAKMKEIILESVVLPNMDDIAFFESLKYEHRGGIWADACRHEHAPTLDSNPSTSGEPATSPPTPIPEMIPGETESVPVARPHSAEDLTIPATFPLTATISAPPSSDRTSSLSSQPRSRTSPSEEIPIPPSDPSSGEASAERTPTISSSDTSRSTPPDKLSFPTEPVEFTEDDEGSVESETSTHLTTNSLRRTPSQRSTASSSRARSVSSSSDRNRADSDSSHTPSKPPNQFRSSVVGTSPSSFFSTLKSRAGDKQALSNTAKEAMRKWGVNWGGLKRENTGGSNFQGGNSGDEDGEAVNGSHKSKTSYADVWASVTERRERGRPYREDNGQSSAPIPIPGAGRATDSDSSRSPPPAEHANSQEGNLEVPQISRHGSTSPERASYTAPAISRSANESRTPDDRADVDDEPDPPIHTQPPQARTMTIPGIHASHRGEVMSMGYAPPPTTPLNPASDNNKLRNPAMQSVYRLLKSPILSPQPQPPRPASEPIVQVDVDHSHEDPPPLPLASPPPVHSRPTPPPLPPRSTSTAVNRISDAGNSTSETLSPASAALKSIVTKDDNSRRVSLDANGHIPSSLASEDAPSGNIDPPVLPAPAIPDRPRGPPLPPRRQQTLS
ncbi:hypothetical protein JAAARDRAFT_120333 [Jaapia argillacea MUCL 33604]|uniref:SMP-LTD domain-containing protein n=1 Tax=Jaapia argillacea MUCL 33604 TaxID=933084 RepID=A0A067Q7L9_9AGAM|nr:hypothetical protein JAAARDRAFT_120333 [Jaapia argillacea MUCL 33604]